MLYAYGVVPPGTPVPDCTGLGDPPQPVRVVDAGPVAVLVSQLDDDHELTADDAATQLDVLVAAVQQGPVLPLRLGTVAADDAEVRDVVAEASSALASDLAALADLVEVQLDADDDEAAVLADLARGVDLPAQADDLSARIDLGHAVAELLVDRRREVAQAIVDELRGHAVDDAPRSQITGPEDPVLRWAFLVRRDELPRFDEAVAALRGRRPDLQITYAGPLPPAHFTGRGAPDQDFETPHDAFHGSGAWGW